MSFPGWRYDVGRVTDLHLVHGRQFQSGSSDLFDVFRATAAGQVPALVSKYIILRTIPRRRGMGDDAD